jgi:hypothetical protein
VCRKRHRGFLPGQCQQRDVSEPEKVLQLDFRRNVGRKHTLNYVNFLGVYYSVFKH